MPTEAEWEYAARAGTETIYWWGDEIQKGDSVMANFQACAVSENRHPGILPVGRFLANPLGLHDTSGNIEEWVEDHYQRSYDDAPNDGSAWLKQQSTSYRVLRGGRYFSRPSQVTSASRAEEGIDSGPDYGGFRLAQDFD